MGVVMEVAARATLGEGPCWDENSQSLYWVDIVKNCLHIYDPIKKENQTVSFDDHVCAVSKKKNGELLLALKDGIYSYHLQSKELALVAQPENLSVDNRFNDGKCDPQGRFWAGTMNMNGKKNQGELYCLHKDGKLTMVFDGVSISNGLAWDVKDNKMFYIDTPTQQVVSFDFDPSTGEIDHKTVVYTFKEEDGSPDGMTIDSDGMLWVALWGGGRVARINPSTKEWVSSVQVPASLVTSCVFGGENLQTLYMTTARIGLTEEELKTQPLAGGLFSIQLDVKGTPSYLY